MGRTACKEPQCLYKGALYLSLFTSNAQTETDRWPLLLRHAVRSIVRGMAYPNTSSLFYSVWWRLLAKAETCRTSKACLCLCLCLTASLLPFLTIKEFILTKISKFSFHYFEFVYEIVEWEILRHFQSPKFKQNLPLGTSPHPHSLYI